MATTRFTPDVATLASTRVVVGVGTSSRGQLARRTALALAERLGKEAVVLPCGHGGFIQEAREFADTPRRVLAS